MIPRTITYDEIRKGDRIRSVWSDGDMTMTREGVADRMAGIWWRTPGDEYLAHRDDDAITLLDRPTPPLPQGQGTPIMVYKYRRANGVEYEGEFVAIRDGLRWRASGARYDDTEILSWAPLTPGDRIDR